MAGRRGGATPLLLLGTADRGYCCAFVWLTVWLPRIPVQVILMHLSNLTGLADDYSKHTMVLLVSDIGTIVMGVTAAIATGYVKVREPLRAAAGSVQAAHLLLYQGS